MKTEHYALILRKNGAVDFIHAGIDTMAGIEMDLADKYTSHAIGKIDGPYYLIVYEEE